MANTTLFAPQVRSVQPAFEYNKSIGGTVKIYFSLSDFNKESEYTHIRYKIIDPNKESGWGSDSMIKDSKGYVEIAKPTNDYFEINLDLNDFKEFTLNQYYQIQLQLINGEEMSAWSQASLIRPISALDKMIIEQSGNMYQLERVSGEIFYKDNTFVEAIKNYYVVIKDSNGNEVYRSSMIDNTLGTKFATYLYDCFLEDGTYKLSIDYTTINGYQGSTPAGQDTEIVIGFDSARAGSLKSFELNKNTDLGAVTLTFELDKSNMLALGNNYQIDIQRASEKSNFTQWLQIKSFKVEGEQTYFKYNDLTIETETVYRYRIVLRSLTTTTQIIYVIDNLNGEYFEILTRIEDIHLLGAHKQLSVKYNPNISGFKYVTQESITNTLGGKFPIVRINGDTKYRQFSLSGTLSFNTDYISLNADGVDSRGVDLRRWWTEENCTLLFDLESLVQSFSPASAQRAKNSSFYLEKKYRDIAVSFLTDQKPKLFRGMAEDTMIVYLSNVLFTPNKQLSREIWDFSCTVTEICEYNRENLIKYDLLKSGTVYTLEYYLKMKQQIEMDGGEISNVTDYVPLEETIDNLPVLYAVWKETGFKGFDAK